MKAKKNYPEVEVVVDVTIDGETIGFTEDEAVNPDEWVDIKTFKKIIKKIETIIDTP